MRIVAGVAGGRRLRTPKGDDVRPTADRVKEALFSSLGPALPDAAVLDLYAGTGALGLEALSRGAARVTFIERAARSIEALTHNVEVVGLAGAEVVHAEVGRALAGELAGAPFDLVFADPPYDLATAEVDGLLAALTRHLAAGAIVVVERDARATPPSWPDVFQPAEPRRYGDTVLHRARYEGEAAASAGGEPPRRTSESVHDEQEGR